MAKVSITMNFYAGLGKSLPDYDIREGLKLDVDDSTTVRQLLDSFNLSYKNIALVVINGKRNTLSTRVSHGDRIDIFPPVGGG